MRANGGINSFIFKISTPKRRKDNEGGIKLPSPLHDLKQKITALMKITTVQHRHILRKHTWYPSIEQHLPSYSFPLLDSPLLVAMHPEIKATRLSAALTLLR